MANVIHLWRWSFLGRIFAPLCAEDYRAVRDKLIQEKGSVKGWQIVVNNMRVWVYLLYRICYIRWILMPETCGSWCHTDGLSLQRSPKWERQEFGCRDRVGRLSRWNSIWSDCVGLWVEVIPWFAKLFHRSFKHQHKRTFFIPTGEKNPKQPFEVVFFRNWLGRRIGGTASGADWQWPAIWLNQSNQRLNVVFSGGFRCFFVTCLVRKNVFPWTNYRASFRCSNQQFLHYNIIVNTLILC